MANVLFLEPDRMLAHTYTQALQHVGHTVASCSTGQEAIELLENFSADCIVMEVQLAGHGGIEFLHELRSYPEWQTVPVAINTNLTPQALAPFREALERDGGVSICLYKPRTSLERLIQVINQQTRQTA